MAKNKREMAVIMPQETALEKIIAYYVDPDKYPLSETLEDIRLRCNEILTLRVKGWTPTRIVKKWEKDRGLSQAQAYIDIKLSESLYGSVLKADKEGSRVIWLMRAENLFARAIKFKDRKAEAAALKMMGEYGGFKDDENKEFNPEKLTNYEIQFAISKQFLPFLKMMHGKGGVDDLNLKEPIDIDYEEIKQELESDKNTPA